MLIFGEFEQFIEKLFGERLTMFFKWIDIFVHKLLILSQNGKLIGQS
jgi:hypothetical protein